MNKLAVILFGLVLIGTVVAGRSQGVQEDKKVVYKVTADSIAKEFKDDAVAAKKKYGATPAPEIQITGTAMLVIGSGKDSEILLENAPKISIRMGVDKRPSRFPVKFSATASYKGYFDMAKELSLTASKISFK
jgi:hypothetical protein